MEALNPILDTIHQILKPLINTPNYFLNSSFGLKPLSGLNYGLNSLAYYRHYLQKIGTMCCIVHLNTLIFVLSMIKC